MTSKVAIFGLFLLITVSASQLNKVEQAFIQNSVIPDILDRAPPDQLIIRYPSGKNVELGNELTPSDVKEQPYLSWDADPHCLYTLVMVDPDVPSRKRPTVREYRHWLVGNIPGNILQFGQPISEYVGLGPPKGTGLHRYVFLVFKQAKYLFFDEPYSNRMEGRLRGGFSVKRFAQKYGLGNPVAGNLFQAQYDESVPSLHAQLGIVIVEVCPIDGGGS